MTANTWVHMEDIVQAGIKTLKLKPKTEKDKSIHRLETGHHMGEAFCIVCLQASLDELCGGNVYPIVGELK